MALTKARENTQMALTRLRVLCCAVLRVGEAEVKILNTSPGLKGGDHSVMVDDFNVKILRDCGKVRAPIARVLMLTCLRPCCSVRRSRCYLQRVAYKAWFAVWFCGVVLRCVACGVWLAAYGLWYVACDAWPAAFGV